MKLIKRYWFFLLMTTVSLVLVAVNRDLGSKAAALTSHTIKEIALVLPPVFILLGLLDIWIPRETMIKYMGEGSGLKGVIIALILGSFAAGPLYAAFPVAGILMSKGAKLSNVIIFIGAWSTTKIPMFLFEMAALGSKFAVTRLLADVPGIIIMAYILSSMLGEEEIEKLYKRTS